MKQLLSWTLLLLATPTFAVGNILSEENLLDLVKHTSMDAFNSAFSHNPDIALDQKGMRMSISQSPLEFSGSSSLKLTKIKLSDNDAFMQKTDTSLGKIEETWVGVNTLINPYVPGGMNPVLKMATQEHTEEYTNTLSTSTTCGWSNGFGYEQVTKVRHAEAAGLYQDKYTFEVVGKVKADTTDTVEISNSYRVTAKSFSVPVPAGCKAIVTQSLASTSFAGEYLLSNKIGNDAQLEFIVGSGSANKHATYSGYVNVMDLINNSTFPQTAISIESSSDLVVLGRGSYSARGTSSYLVSVEYQEAEIGKNYCLSPSAASFEDSIMHADGMRVNSNNHAASIKIARTRNGFNFTLPAGLENKKLLAKKQTIKTSFRSFNEAETAKCWSGFDKGNLFAK